MRVKKIFQFEGFKISANASRVIITSDGYGGT